MSRCAVSHRGDAPAKSAGGRLSKRQKRLLCGLDAEERRPDRVFSSRRQKLVQTLPNTKGNISHSLRLLDARSLVEIGRSLGGQADNVRRTSEGCQKASDTAGSYD